MELNWAPRHNWQDAGPAPAPPAPLWPVPGQPPPPPPAPPAGAGTTTHGEPVGTSEALTLTPEGDDGNGPDGLVPGREEVLPPPRSLTLLREVSFRTRISVLVGVAVGIAVAMAALVSYVAVSRQLEQQAKSNLQSAVVQLPSLVRFEGSGLLSRPIIDFQLRTGDQVQVIIGGPQATQVYSVNAQQDTMPETPFFPLTPTSKQVLAASAEEQTVQTEQGTDGNPYLVATVSVITNELAVQIGYPMSNVDNTLAFLRLILVLVAVGGAAVATGLGWLVGRASIRPVETLSWAAEHVAETQDLSATIDDTGNDELGRLARSFNAMLGALAASRQQQAQLVSDAGHELRTPLTSLRTNIEVLMKMRDLPSDDREALLSDVDSQLKELTTLVGDLVDLARDDERLEAEPEAVPFAELVQRAVDRAQRRGLSLHFDVSLQPGQVRAQPALLERAVMNVLDNAAKWSPVGGRVGVTLVSNGAWHLTVTDEGPGVAPQDLPHIFERFYRAQTARSMPGSGLGLAIVKRVIASHGGTVEVTSPAGGGTRVDIELPLDNEPAS
ncbi:MAG: ATP-binding protein [Acidimicrobiales bacterium]